ncbi:MAG: LysE family translocator [Hyphomicrobiales bacterium]
MARLPTPADHAKQKRLPAPPTALRTWWFMDILISLIGFSLATFMTPGPNNIMLLSSGARFGFQPTIPHILGVALGFAVMATIVGLGLAQVFVTHPEIHDAVKWVAAAYLLYLAWRISGAGGAHGGDGRGRPLTFLEAALFQWMNPKGWTIALSVIPLYMTRDGDPYFEIARIALVFLFVGLGSASTWAAFGKAISRLVAKPRAARIFNIAMALLLVASIVPILF